MTKTNTGSFKKVLFFIGLSLAASQPLASAQEIQNKTNKKESVKVVEEGALKKAIEITKQNAQKALSFLKEHKGTITLGTITLAAIIAVSCLTIFCPGFREVVIIGFIWKTVIVWLLWQNVILTIGLGFKALGLWIWGQLVTMPTLIAQGTLFNFGMLAGGFFTEKLKEFAEKMKLEFQKLKGLADKMKLDMQKINDQKTIEKTTNSVVTEIK